MTAELALGLPVVVVVLAAVLMLVAAATAQMRCADAARAAARSVALGEDAAVQHDVVARVAGAGATSSTRSDGDWVTVRVEAPVVGWLSAVPLTASAEAVARAEP
ncbi:hypothetical protein CLV28_0772 [Sediminihabitans luteus]|uniref:TadE-like protein n=1 Tax=Sediminihabitans luteus TaxID=1138585 RepID=A0A2M9D028_9CELL|nr:TadE family type IV pilus minor pilin [Sediminihabitans luteus]PJJ77551.1 hypothetical protein CLV28_0772 [Sediminihabitans luteus]